MAITARIEPLDRDIAVLLRSDLSPEAQRKALGGFAREMLAEAQDINRRALGRVPRHLTFVDGRQGAALENVNPRGGTIVFEFELFGELFAFVDAMLVLNSPYRTGRYARSHVFLADGVVADPLREPAAASNYFFVNTQPYARRIERRQAVYEMVADMARRRYGRLADIRLTYRNAPGGRGRDTRNPAILIWPK